MTPRRDAPKPEACVLLVDKPQGITSHDVVARARRALGTRKIGHAGTLDPMATGLLVLGVEGATRLLTYVVGLDKTYEATIRLGVATDTDDAEGETVATTDAAGVTRAAVDAGIAALTGRISQVPSTFSAIKVDGRRAYDLARAGEEVQLKAREVTVSRFDVLAERRPDDAAVIDLDVVVDCSSGTYIRSLARDLGAALGVGGHLTALRRTRIGSFDVAEATLVADIADAPRMAPADAATAVLARFDVTADEARDLRHGKRLTGAGARLVAVPSAAVDPGGVLVGIVERRGDDVKSALNMPGEAAR
ncbi:tRNA pseudouridine55 synthase [Microbacterium terrae]|uniref:tRNA pseudouridine synthase B n=1 Tax=Microbacterium terrae TaxID=69369 RepID=A0A0M2H5E6_9MICO|nr:tRNA pseudouridine(55) synthase TruB [Microbacterium terrae]KJL39055.1 tRNA pseudouridine synthase B [Microbacterium terrae]MBP1077790.1 tRNA pseudouridine55 synthase [Microbacterium terrae]GLJ99959.1 tRNA pseudouridine synthase B [Microbacterium terrae]